MEQITQILGAIDQGDPHAPDQLLPIVYEELRRLATRKMSDEKPGQTLQPTALVHEAYLRLIGGKSGNHWDGRGHFFAAASGAMRRILIENARRKRGPTSGGRLRRVDASLDEMAVDLRTIDILALDEALMRLTEASPVRAELVKLRFFAGLTIPEAAEVLGISVATADRYWVYAKTKLFVDLGGGGPIAEARKNSPES